MFGLHPQLEKDCVVLGQFKLCLLLMNRDANYPWFILVPQREAVQEIFQLSGDEQQQLLAESSLLSQVLMDVLSGHKLNVAALGNMVPQLHIHHIVRYRNDPAWPNPVWGAVSPLAYEEQQMQARIDDVVAMLDGEQFTPAS